MSMEIIRYALVDHTPEELITAYATAAASLAAAPECLGYDLTQCEEDERTFILQIRWTSTPAHLEGFRKGANFPPFLAAIRPFIPEIVEMRHYRATKLAWERPA